MAHEHGDYIDRWYEPESGGLPAPAYSAPAKSAARIKKANPVQKTVMLILAAIVLIAAISMALSDTGGSAPKPAPTLPWSFGGDPYEGYDDYRDFFSDLYEDFILSSGVNYLPTMTPDAPLALTLAPRPTGEPLSYGEVYKRCRSAVVSVITYKKNSMYATGTGIILTENGYILTNSHVLDDSDQAKILLHDGTEYTALLAGYDPQTDVAVLKIEASGLESAQLGDSALLQVGDEVVAIGNPLGEEFRGTMTNGIVSAINRDVSYNGTPMSYIQTNAALNEGNSGGPLINMYGQVVGITNMKMMSVYSSIEGIGFAIPTASALPVIDRLFTGESETGETSIGITVGVMPEEDVAHFQIPRGLFITGVAEGSDAQAKGVKQGDILVAVNGKPVTTTAEVLRFKEGLSVGDTLDLTLYREGRTFSVTVALVDSGTIRQH